MRKLVIVFSLSCVCYAQQPQVDIVKSEILPYDKSKTRLTVSVKNVAANELHDIWVKVSGSGSKTYRRKVPYLKPDDTRNVTIDAPSDDGPWMVDIESVDWANQ